ncbi:MAG: hypothetical protein RLZ98_697 [Pseudomonadota bacterium]|jgi:acetoin utilization deacetylase AcuC-like enzyme
MARTGFYWNERCFWHSGGNYAFLLPATGLVQPAIAGGLPENPETKRRLKNLMDVTGLIGELRVSNGAPASDEDLARVHGHDYLAKFRTLSDADGGELGQRTPFSTGGYEIAALSAGLIKTALADVLAGRIDNAYALCRPPGHHCLPDLPMGYCLLANIAIAIEAALAAAPGLRFAVVDWDVHHGNGTEAIFLARDDVLTISLHQDNCYPPGKGGVEVRGEGKGEGYNINVPLPPGSGHDAYIYAMDCIVLPAIRRFRPDAMIVASGFDASGVDVLGRMLATSETFAEMTRRLMAVAEEVSGGRIAMAHEGGYSEVHVPFCGHAVIQALAGSRISAPDPLLDRIVSQQPNARVVASTRAWIDELSEFILA